MFFEGIQSLFGHQASAGILGSQAGMTPGLGETVVNNYYGSDPGASGWGQNDQDFSSSGTDPNADQDFSSQDYGSGDQDFASDQDFSSDDFDNNQC